MAPHIGMAFSWPVSSGWPQDLTRSPGQDTSTMFHRDIATFALSAPWEPHDRRLQQLVPLPNSPSTRSSGSRVLHVWARKIPLRTMKSAVLHGHRYLAELPLLAVESRRPFRWRILIMSDLE